MKRKIGCFIEELNMYCDWDHHETVAPVICRDETYGQQYFGMGSALFVNSRQNIYCVTAKHVMDNQRITVEDLFITPSIKDMEPIKFEPKESIELSEVDGDASDLAIFRVDLEAFGKRDSHEIHPWDIQTQFIDTESLEQGNLMGILGYPSEHRFVNLEEARIHITVVRMGARYLGTSHEPRCHTVRFPGDPRIQDLDGFSGGPVFRHSDNPAIPIQLAGVSIRGTVESKLLHFVDCSVIKDSILAFEG